MKPDTTRKTRLFDRPLWTALDRVYKLILLFTAVIALLAFIVSGQVDPHISAVAASVDTLNHRQIYKQLQTNDSLDKIQSKTTDTLILAVIEVKCMLDQVLTPYQKSQADRQYLREKSRWKKPE